MNTCQTQCRRCSECAAMSHHWIPDPMPLDDPEYLPGDYACKHCDQRGDGCEACAGDGYLDGDERRPCDRCSQEGVVPLRMGPTDLAIRTIIDNWIDWDGQAGQISQQEQSSEAGIVWLHEQIRAVLQRHLDV